MESLTEPTIEASLQNFISTLTTKLRQYFPSEECAEQINDNSYRFHIAVPVTMENLFEILEKTLKLHTLYAIGIHQEKDQICVMYSRPVSSMYIIYMYSTDYGKIESFNAIFFTSIDEFFIKLNDDLARSKKLVGIPYSKRQTPLQLALNFQ